MNYFHSQVLETHVKKSRQLFCFGFFFPLKSSVVQFSLFRYLCRKQWKLYMI